MTNTTIKLLQNVDLTRDYKHTFTFSDATSQYNFFNAKALRTMDQCSFQRRPDVKGGKIRYDGDVEEVRNVSYVMYQNQDYSSKWFYGFVTKVEFKNDSVAMIDFEIDVMQTWAFDYTVHQAFVEREHVSDDTIGKHLVDENLRTGDIIALDQEDETRVEELTTVVATTQASDGTPVYGGLFSGVYSGLGYGLYDSDTSGISTLKGELAVWTDPSSIYSIFTMPTVFLPSYLNGTILLNDTVATTITKTLPKALSGDDIDGYIPKNNKLYTFPYRFLRIVNNQGDYTDIKFERSSGVGLVTVSMTCEIAQNPSVMLSVNDYKGMTKNYEDGIVLSGFPTCAWSTDVYNSWLSQNKARNFAQGVSSVGALAFGLTSMNPVAIGGGVLGVASTIGNYIDKDSIPNQAKGSIQGSTIIANDKMTFTYKDMGVTSEFAKIIDEFFSTYGYKVNRVKVPNITGRENWNYVKCTDANITGNLNVEDLETIRNNFNKGITFWHSDNIGNYSLSNNIV